MREQIAWMLAEWYYRTVDGKNSHDEGWEAFSEEDRQECLERADLILER